MAESLRVIGSMDLPGRYVQCRDDGYGAVADVLELPPGDPARRGRPFGVVAVFGLDSGLLIDADHRGVRRWAQVGVADRGGLGPELLVVAAVEPAPHPVRRQFDAGQDPPHLRHRDADLGQFGGDQGVCPHRHPVRRRRRGCGHDLQPHVRAIPLGTAAARPVGQGEHPATGEAAPPGTHRAHRAAHLGGDLLGGPALVREQHDPGPAHQRLRRGRPANDRLELGLAPRSQHDGVLADRAGHKPPPGERDDHPTVARTRSAVASTRRIPRQ